MASSPAAYARLGKATALTIVLGVFMVLMPLGMMLFMPLLVLPAVHLTARWGVPYAAALVVVASGALYYLAGPGTGVLVFLMLSLVGVTLGIALRKHWSFASTLTATAYAAGAALVASGFAFRSISGLRWTDLRAIVHGSIDNAADMYNQMGLSQASTEVVARQLRQLFDVLPYVLPGLVAAGALVLAGALIGLAYVLFPKLREKVEVSMSLTGFRMHWAAAYASIVGLALLVFSRGAGGWQDVALYAGLNILLISQTVFFYQGLAVIHWFGKSRQASRGARSLAYMLAVLGQLLFQLTGLLGLFDTWLDCRKRFALKTPGSGSAG